MESLSSFIGIDGTNTTLNSGRILINLKPLDERKISASDVIRRLQPELAECRGHHAVHAAGAGPHGGRPRQPHAVPVHAGRSQRRRAEHLRAADAGASCRSCRSCATWPATSRCRACAPGWCSTATRPRAWASRPPPSIRRSTTPTASGEVSTMFTQLNQYHVVLEVKPEFQQNPAGSARPVHPHRRRHSSAAAPGWYRAGRPPAVVRPARRGQHQLPPPPSAPRRPAATRFRQRLRRAPSRPPRRFPTAARCR